MTKNRELKEIMDSLRNTEMESLDGWCLLKRLVAVFPELNENEKTNAVRKIFGLSKAYYRGTFGYEAKMIILWEVVGFTSIKAKRMIWEFCLNELKQRKRFYNTEVCKALGGIFSSLPEREREKEWEKLLTIAIEEDLSAPARKFSAMKALRYASLSNDEAEILWTHIHKMLRSRKDDNIVLQIAAKLFPFLDEKRQEEISACLKNLGMFYLEENRKSEKRNHRHIVIGNIFCAIRNIFLSSPFSSERKEIRADLLGILKEGMEIGGDKNWLIEDDANGVVSRIWSFLIQEERNILSPQI